MADARSLVGCSARNPFQSYHQTVTSLISVLRHWGGIGVLILAALDSSVLPTLGGVDALTILLAARHPELWPYYAMCSTAGSLSGASLAYRLSALGVLHRRIKGAVFDRVTAFVKRFGSLALSLAALLPPPFPTSAFVISAGATRYRFIAFVLSFGVGRACKGAENQYPELPHDDVRDGRNHTPLGRQRQQGEEGARQRPAKLHGGRRAPC